MKKIGLGLGAIIAGAIAIPSMLGLLPLRGAAGDAALAATSETPPASNSALPASVKVNPQRDVFFGDLHLHTSNSYDAYVLMGTKTTTDDAYKFARGETVTYMGAPVRRAWPLDFMAVTDHSEYFGVFNQLEDKDSAFAHSEVGQLGLQGTLDAFARIRQLFNTDKAALASAHDAFVSAWQRNIAAANANNIPGKFTAFIGYEWSSIPNGQNLHRNVIFEGSTAPVPFSSIDSQNPEDLWAWLTRIRAQGYEALAISHNANVSNGLMFDWTRLDGRPIDEGYAQMQAMNEPLTEVVQCKGQSESNPMLSPEDEFSNYEIEPYLLVDDVKMGKVPGSYWRQGLGRGLVLGQKLGTNPFKQGAAAGSDIHTGLSASYPKGAAGCGAMDLPNAPISKAKVDAVLKVAGPGETLRYSPQYLNREGGLTAIWAESNTRKSLFAGLRRKETYATSGTRIKLRFFGGWAYPSNMITSPDWVKTADAGGVPMGGDLPLASGKAPNFAIQAIKDPLSANLDRVQIVKVWLEGGQPKEHVFDVAWSGNRQIDKNGKLPAVGNTVDLKTGEYTNSIGAVELATVWTDPDFKADEAAVYYVRVLEIPTPRWSTYLALKEGRPLLSEVPATVQGRAWSSPIWYTPRAKG